MYGVKRYNFENPSGEASDQNIPAHNMANVPPPGGNQPPPPPLGGNQPPPPPSGGNQPPPPLGALAPWLGQDVVVVPGKQHPLPKNIERVLPNFDPQ